MEWVYSVPMPSLVGKFTRVYEITCTLIINIHFFLKQILYYFSAVIYDILANIRLRILMLLGPGSCSIGSKTFYDNKLFCSVGTVDHFHPSPIFVKKAECTALAPNIRLGWNYWCCGWIKNHLRRWASCCDQILKVTLSWTWSDSITCVYTRGPWAVEYLANLVGDKGYFPKSFKAMILGFDFI